MNAQDIPAEEPAIRCEPERPLFGKLWLRWITAAILVTVLSTVLVGGMATYLPLQQTDRIGVPILLFPLIWAGLFTATFLVRRIGWFTAALAGITVIHVFLIFRHLGAG